MRALEQLISGMEWLLVRTYLLMAAGFAFNAVVSAVGAVGVFFDFSLPAEARLATSGVFVLSVVVHWYGARLAWGGWVAAR